MIRAIYLKSARALIQEGIIDETVVTRELKLKDKFKDNRSLPIRRYLVE